MQALGRIKVRATLRRMSSGRSSEPTEASSGSRLDAAHRTLLDNLPVIVFRLDPTTGRPTFVNGAFTRLLGRPPLQAYEDGLDVVLADDVARALFRSQVAGAASGEALAWTDWVFVAADGHRIAARMLLYPVRNEHGRVEAIEGIARDVQAEVEARRKLIQADRLAAIGQLAAGVAHEINNPAAFVALGVQQLARGLPALRTGDEAAFTHFEEVLQEISSGVQRIVATIGELKLFSRIPEGAFSTPVDVNRLIQSAVVLTRSELRGRAHLTLDLGELPLLPGDHARLGQVFVNLLFNAAQAIPIGDPGKHEVRVETRGTASLVRVRISDTGVGIPPDVLPRIFDPFFSTRPEQGVGLGLAIGHDVVRQAGGTIEVESTPGRGTIFTVELPVRDVDAPEALPAPLRRARRVLIVDDERALTSAMARQLAGPCDVEVAGDGHDALARLRENDFDAVLCDLRIPGLSGPEVYEEIQRIKPELARRFVFVTGTLADPGIETFLRAAGRPVLHKPFDAAELDAIVSRVLEEGSSSGKR